MNALVVISTAVIVSSAVAATLTYVGYFSRAPWQRALDTLLRRCAEHGIEVSFRFMPSTDAKASAVFVVIRRGSLDRSRLFFLDHLATELPSWARSSINALYGLHTTF